MYGHCLEQCDYRGVVVNMEQLALKCRSAKVTKQKIIIKGYR